MDRRTIPGIPEGEGLLPFVGRKIGGAIGSIYDYATSKGGSYTGGYLPDEGVYNYDFSSNEPSATYSSDPASKRGRRDNYSNIEPRNIPVQPNVPTTSTPPAYDQEDVQYMYEQNQNMPTTRRNTINGRPASDYKRPKRAGGWIDNIEQRDDTPVPKGFYVDQQGQRHSIYDNAPSFESEAVNYQRETPRTVQTYQDARGYTAPRNEQGSQSFNRREQIQTPMARISQPIIENVPPRVLQQVTNDIGIQPEHLERVLKNPDGSIVSQEEFIDRVRNLRNSLDATRNTYNDVLKYSIMSNVMKNPDLNRINRNYRVNNPDLNTINNFGTVNRRGGY